MPVSCIEAIRFTGICFLKSSPFYSAESSRLRP